MRSRLKKDSGKWDFVDRRFEIKPINRYAALYLRKSLADVFRGTITLEEQVERFILHGREAINLLLSGRELEDLTNRLYPLAKNSSTTTQLDTE